MRGGGRGQWGEGGEVYGEGEEDCGEGEEVCGEGEEVLWGRGSGGRRERMCGCERWSEKKGVETGRHIITRWSSYLSHRVSGHSPLQTCRGQVA